MLSPALDYIWCLRFVKAPQASICMNLYAHPIGRAGALYSSVMTRNDRELGYT
jgi:hypothetical protein